MINRARRLSFTFDGAVYGGHPGDTLASALLANGVRLFGRSFKYHRPRGVLSAGHEEPNALVELRSGARREPNTKATVVELYDGLESMSQNRWPSLQFDAMAVNGLLKPAFAAGFYYKTFMWPASFWEKVYEPIIRRAAGLGRAAGVADPDAYERDHLHCDLLVVGGGPAGLMAALSAGRAGARVVLCDDDVRLGGRLLAERVEVDGQSGPDFADAVAAELKALPTVTVLTRTAVVAAFDQGTFAAVERVADNMPAPKAHQPRQRFWTIVAKAAILATGATERPIVFPNNDRPGVMLAGAVQSYANRHAVAAGKSIAVYTATDAGWTAARDLLAAGAAVAAVIDTRGATPPGFEDVGARVRTVPGGRVTNTHGRLGVTAIDVASAAGTSRLDVDVVAVSGGFNPSIQLISHFGVRPTWNERIAGFVIPQPVKGIRCAGAAAGHYGLSADLADGIRAAGDALGEIGIAMKPIRMPTTAVVRHDVGTAWWQPAPGDIGAKAFVDLQHDVAASDVMLAHREGFRSVEHLKRYTTLGMATDQGRTSNTDGLAIMALLSHQSIPQTGVTLARPPTVPLAIGAVAGGHRGTAFRPVRRTPVHGWAQELGAVFVDVGQWKRPQYFPRSGETDWLQTVNREVETVRSAVGVTDVSTLGKIEVEGPDAAAYLDRVCATRPSAIPVGSCGYMVMLREDGIVKDDGMIARFAPDRFFAFVSTVHAAAVYRHMQYCRQVLWPDLDVTLTAVTDAWAQLAVAGPKSARVVGALVDAPTVVDMAGFPPMSCREVTVCGGVPARLYGLSFSGERAFEIGVPARYGEAFARRIMEVGAEHGITAYGTEAMAVMRVEKGYPAGAEINGQTTAADLGLAPALATDKDHVGRVLSARQDLTDGRRARLVGLKPVDAADRLRGGAHVLAKGAAPEAANDLGWITSAAWSPTARSSIALAMVAGGPDRLGEVVRVWDGIRNTDMLAEIVPPCFVDPEGNRIHDA
nr:sarcosine oxidase subunit alpha family protein [Chthonobacter rhizosphaerae]